jgi:hypothetical protein
MSDTRRHQPNATVPDAARSPRKGCDGFEDHGSRMAEEAIKIIWSNWHDIPGRAEGEKYGIVF